MPREGHVGKDHDGHCGLVCVDFGIGSSLDIMLLYIMEKCVCSLRTKYNFETIIS
jgi:hypothetical protein